MSESLTQEQIDAMLKAVATQEASTITDSSVDEQTKIDIIGEVGNISMSQAATTLSSILNRRVSITTPKVKKIEFSEIIAGLSTPKVTTAVEFKEGLFGSNLMLLEVKDAIIIADLMMGGDGTTKNEAFGELELSAVSEAMNQMIGSASTSMATMINRKVDILPPVVNVWKSTENVNLDDWDEDEELYRISFSLTVEGLIESEIMQVFNLDVVNDIVAAMLSDKATVVQREPKMHKEDIPVKPRPQKVQEEIGTTSTLETVPAKSNVAVQKPVFQQLNLQNVTEGNNLDLIMDVPLELSVVLGRAKRSVKDILSMSTGSVIELDTLTNEPLEILLNGKLIARGEVVVINESFGVRITNILSQKQRIYNLHD
ncbi:flagellar motor switch phosphatase FliY [Enterococcus italicus]